MEWDVSGVRFTVGREHLEVRIRCTRGDFADDATLPDSWRANYTYDTPFAVACPVEKSAKGADLPLTANQARLHSVRPAACGDRQQTARGHRILRALDANQLQLAQAGRVRDYSCRRLTDHHPAGRWQLITPRRTT